MSKKAAIFLCDESGNMARPWAAAGFDCWCVDLAHPVRKVRTDGPVRFVYGDARSWVPPVRDIAFVAAFPPCTHLAGSGARDFETKGLRLLTDSLDLFNACLHAATWSGAPFLVENPRGVLSTHVRKPDHEFDPCDYAGYLDDPAPEAYTKRTCLWTGNGFRMPPPRRVEPVLGSRMHTLPPGRDRQRQRSLTPRGFAQAVFEANCPAMATGPEGGDCGHS